MKAVSAALKGHFGQATTTLAVIWKVTRTDGTVLGFTTFDKDLVYNSVTYHASSGILPTANKTQSDLTVDNLEITGFLDSALIKETDIRNGVYDFARVEQRVVNWNDLTQGDVQIRAGMVGNITMKNGLFLAELRGLTQFLSTLIGSLYGPLCRAELFSTPTGAIDPGTHYPCWVKEADYLQNGSVSSAADALHITPNAGLKMIGSTTPSAAAPANWFQDGNLIFTSGANNGFRYEIKSWDGPTLTLFLPMNAPPLAGDSFIIAPGCDKTNTATGCQKFQGYSSDGSQTIVAATNILNYRGEAQIPGTDSSLAYPNATTA